MAYLVLAFPELAPADFDRIQACRAERDKLLYTVVDPHFTIVFAVSDISETEFVREIKEKVTGSAKFGFAIRCATTSRDAFRPLYHTFLVPDEGYSRFVKLHDRLYSGKLKSNLRLDLDYVPHIG